MTEGRTHGHFAGFHIDDSIPPEQEAAAEAAALLRLAGLFSTKLGPEGVSVVTQLTQSLLQKSLKHALTTPQTCARSCFCHYMPSLSCCLAWPSHCDRSTLEGDLTTAPQAFVGAEMLTQCACTSALSPGCNL